MKSFELNETFAISLKSIRIHVMNDMITTNTSQRIPVMELLVLVDPRSEAHSYGSIRHW